MLRKFPQYKDDEVDDRVIIEDLVRETVDTIEQYTIQHQTMLYSYTIARKPYQVIGSRIYGTRTAIVRFDNFQRWDVIGDLMVPFLCQELEDNLLEIAAFDGLNENEIETEYSRDYDKGGYKFRIKITR